MPTPTNCRENNLLSLKQKKKTVLRRHMFTFELKIGDQKKSLELHCRTLSSPATGGSPELRCAMSVKYTQDFKYLARKMTVK